MMIKNKRCLMNTTQLECFLAVTEYLNFSKAAEIVKMTQPAVSHQIRTLEDELETKLFMRTSKKVELTQSGIQFIHDAERILNISQTAKSRLHDFRENEIVFFGIGCHNQMELNLFPLAVQKIREEFPTVHPVLRMIPFESIENLLEDEQIHIMFGIKNSRRKKRTGVYQELAQCPIVCVCRKDNALAKKDSLSQEDLKGNLVMCEPRKGPGIIFQIQNHIAMNPSPFEVYFGGEFETCLALVKAGVGFTLLPDIPGTRQDELSYIPVSGFETISFGIYYKSLKSHQMLKRFIEILKEQIQEG